MLLARASSASRPLFQAGRIYKRCLSTLEQNPYIYIFPHPQGPANTHLLTLLPTSPPTPDLAIASTTTIPPTPATLTENPHFMEVLQTVVAANATADPVVQAAAQSFATTSGSLFSPGQARRHQPQQNARDAARGGFVHVADQRNPPDWGRIAYPEDILGSVQVDGLGRFVGVDGGYQRSGTYRVITNEGILGLSPYLREKLTEHLQQIEKDLKLKR